MSAYASVNGVDIYYEVHGRGRPLVLLHGALGTIESCFQDLLPALAASFRVIAVELQGHGHTRDVERPFSLRDMAEDVAGLFRLLGIETADVFGYRNDRQIVSGEWVRAATGADNPTDQASYYGYRYFWWLDVDRLGRFYPFGEVRAVHLRGPRRRRGHRSPRSQLRRRPEHLACHLPRRHRPARASTVTAQNRG